MTKSGYVLNSMFVQLFLLVALVRSDYLDRGSQQSIKNALPLDRGDADFVTSTIYHDRKSDLVKRQADPPTTPVFNPLGADNVAVYIGHSPGNFNASLPQLCNDTNINIIILGFIRQFNGLNQLPTFDISTTCDSRKVKNFTALFSCPAYAAQVAQCQAQGKKIFISIGGSSSNTTFTTSQQASDTAMTIWNVFLAGTSTPSLRPFGNVTLDGVDVGKNPLFAPSLIIVQLTSLQIKKPPMLRSTMTPSQAA